MNFKRLILGLALALVLIVGVVPAFGQAVAQVYPVKFVCGYQIGDVPLLSDPSPLTPPKPYEELKPGNYATLINIINTDFTTVNQSFTPAFVIEGVGPISSALIRTLAPLATTKVGCPEILRTLTPFLPTAPIGQVFEGYALFVTTPNDPLQIDVVYTYESKDAFKEHIVWGLGPDGTVPDGALNLLHSGFKFGNFPNIFDFPVIDIGASGAGGLGLGASIDVERVLPRDVITTPGVKNPLAELMPK